MQHRAEIVPDHVSRLTHTASFGRSDTGSEIKYCLDDHYIKPLATGMDESVLVN